jgi:protein involved in polysaccharide export with SLBB domain
MKGDTLKGKSEFGMCIRISSVLLASAVLVSGSSAQIETPFTIPDLSKLKPQLKKEVPAAVGRQVPMDSPVNPEEYTVGPNDVLGFNVWSSAPVEERLTVTPEGTVLIPNVGPVDVRGLTLFAARKKIEERARQRYVNSEISVNLLEPRQVLVQIGGNVLYEKQYEVSSTARVDQLLEIANKPEVGLPVPLDYEDRATATRLSASRRNIALRRREGTLKRVDLVKYEVTRDGRYNPYLQEGDIVQVPWVNAMGGEIGIYGGVIRPGNFEFVPGDSLADLLRMGYGFKATADSENVELSRMSEDGTILETMRVNGSAVLTGDRPNIALKPGDRVVVSERTDQRQSYRAIVEGEVAQPGQYPIARKGTTLTSVIKAAGGFTPDAHIGGSLLLRSVTSPQQTRDAREQEKLFSLRSNLNPEDSLYYLTETELRLTGEVVPVDFEKLFVQGDTTLDVSLLPYDKIIVPRKRGTVYVFGQVISPGHFPFEEGKSASFYITRAGGFTSDARTGDVRVIKGSTRAWLSPDETSVEQGDYIWIPREFYRPFAQSLAIYAQLASIIAVVLTAVVVLK